MTDRRRTSEDAHWSKALDDLFDPYDLPDAPGGAVGVALREHVIYSRAFGLANVELGVPNTLQTRFRIASITKHFTCLTALLLAEEGKINIDASIRAYVPELDIQSGEPTLRQLMNHSSGYRCYIDLGFIADGPVAHPAFNALELQLQQRRGNFPPGERVIYCNGSYSLLSLAIERVAQKPFGEALRDLVLQPLGMLDTTLVPSDFEVHARLANLYIRRNDSWRRWMFFSEGMSGEGGLISSVDDMLRWACHLRNPKLVGSEESWKQMLSPTVLPNGHVSGYSLGLELDTYRGAKLIRHSGGVVGGTSHLVTVPEYALDLFVVTNGSAAMVTDLGSQIMDTILGKELGRKTEGPVVERYRHLLGQYHCSRTGMLLGLVEFNGSIALSLVGGPPVPLYATAGGLAASFLKSMAGDWLIHHAGGSDKSGEALVVSDCGHQDTYRRVEEKATPEASFGDLERCFYSPELKARARFRLASGQAALRIHGPFGFSEWEVRTITPDLFLAVNRIFPVWTAAINLRRDDQGVVGFEMSSKRTRELAFHRIGKTGSLTDLDNASTRSK